MSSDFTELNNPAFGGMVAAWPRRSYPEGVGPGHLDKDAILKASALVIGDEVADGVVMSGALTDHGDDQGLGSSMMPRSGDSQRPVASWIVWPEGKYLPAAM